MASRSGTGCQGPAASISATKPGSSPSMRGAGDRARRPAWSSPPSKVRPAKVGFRRDRREAVAFDGEAQQGDARAGHSADPQQFGDAGVAFSPLPVSTSTVVCSGLIVPAASSLANAASHLRAGRLDINADAGQIEQRGGDLRLAQHHRAAARLAQRRRGPRGSRIGWAIAVPSAMVGWIGVATSHSAGQEGGGDRPAIRRLGGENARHRFDLAGAQQLGKADRAAQHVGAGAARRDDVVRRAEAQILPQFVGQRLGAVQEERVPVVAGVEDGCPTARTAASAVSCRRARDQLHLRAMRAHLHGLRRAGRGRRHDRRPHPAGRGIRRRPPRRHCRSCPPAPRARPARAAATASRWRRGP